MPRRTRRRGNAALTDHHLLRDPRSRHDDPWRPWILRSTLALAVCVVVVLAVFFTVQIRFVSQNYSSVAKLQSDVANMQQQHAAQLETLNARVDQLERVLFGDVVAKIEKSPLRPNAVELWQRNRDKELRDRIRQLELWRLRSGDQW